MKPILVLLASLLLLSPWSAALAAKGTVVVYTGANEELDTAVMKAFMQKYPEIEVKSVRTSSGPAVEKVIAEKNNPQADVIYSVNTILLEQLKKAGVVEPYKPKGSVIPDKFMDPDHFYVHHWLTLMVAVVNTKVLADKKLPVPASWEDLAKPQYKGLITVAGPTKSGTGLTIFTTLLDAYGWGYIDRLHKNVFQYNESGGAAGRQAGAGETAVGLTYDTVAFEQVKAGLPVKPVFMNPTPNIMEGGALVLGAPRSENAKLLLDFLASPEGVKVYAPFVGAATAPGHGNVDISKIELYRMKRPVDAAAFKREWTQKYEGK